MGIQAAIIITAIITIIIVLIIFVLFNISVQKAMKAVSERNQKLNPGLIWLNLIPIPIFSPIWTAYYCLITCQSMDKDAGKKIAPLQVAIGYFVAIIINAVIGIFNGDYSFDFSSGANFRANFINSSDTGPLSLVSSIVGLVGLVLFIVFWVQIVKARKELEQMNREGGVGGSEDLLDQPM